MVDVNRWRRWNVGGRACGEPDPGRGVGAHEAAYAADAERERRSAVAGGGVAGGVGSDAIGFAFYFSGATARRRGNDRHRRTARRGDGVSVSRRHERSGRRGFERGQTDRLAGGGELCAAGGIARGAGGRRGRGGVGGDWAVDAAESGCQFDDRPAAGGVDGHRLRVQSGCAMPPANQAAQFSAMDDAGVQAVARRQPVARFWVLALLLAIAAALSGYWTFAAGSDTWNVKDLYETIHQNAAGQDYRLNAHLIAGAGIVVLMLLMALIARAAEGRRVLMGLFSLLLVALIAAQVSVGILLLMDSPAGPFRFNSAASDNSSTPATTTPIKMAPATATSSQSLSGDRMSKAKPDSEKNPKLIAYRIHKYPSMPIVPATSQRRWMDRTSERFAYRCLPLLIANQHGWFVLNVHKVRVVWDGQPDARGAEGGLRSGAGGRALSGGEPFRAWRADVEFELPVSHVAGLQPLARGPANMWKPGIVPLEGIIETDWTVATFTMNWKMTMANQPVDFLPGEPICMIVPVRRRMWNRLSRWCVIWIRARRRKRPMTNGPRGGRSSSRILRSADSEARQEKWQKDYMQGGGPGGRCAGASGKTEPAGI